MLHLTCLLTRKHLPYLGREIMHIPLDTILLKLELNVFLSIPTLSIISLHILMVWASVVIMWMVFHIPMALIDQGQVLLRDLLLDHGHLRSLLEPSRTLVSLSWWTDWKTSFLVCLLDYVQASNDIPKGPTTDVGFGMASRNESYSR